MKPVEFLNPDFHYAVVGATTNTTKYGYTVLKDLADAGFSVVGINPHYSDIDGIPVYPSLEASPRRPDVAVFVLPPAAGLLLLDTAVRLKVPRVWFQPGAENDAIRQRINQLGLVGIADGSCIMVARRSLGVHG